MEEKIGGGTAASESQPVECSGIGDRVVRIPSAPRLPKSSAVCSPGRTASKPTHSSSLWPGIHKKGFDSVSNSLFQ